MSAYIVNDYHISALVNSVSAHEFHTWHNGATQNFTQESAGQILKDENYRSVNSRYQEDDKAPPFDHDLMVSKQPVEILMGCRCFNYQACESDDWDQTLAHSILEMIQSHAIRRVTEGADGWSFEPPKGYVKANVIPLSTMFKRR